MPGREGSRCLTRQEQVASYSRALVMTAATATTLRAAVLLRRMSLSRSRAFPGVCMKAHKGVFQGAPRGGAHTSPPILRLKVHFTTPTLTTHPKSCSMLRTSCALQPNYRNLLDARTSLQRKVLASCKRNPHGNLEKVVFSLSCMLYFRQDV